jgi:hypothetical protein
MLLFLPLIWQRLDVYLRVGPPFFALLHTSERCLSARQGVLPAEGNEIMGGADAGYDQGHKTAHFTTDAACRT